MDDKWFRRFSILCKIMTVVCYFSIIWNITLVIIAPHWQIKLLSALTSFVLIRLRILENISTKFSKIICNEKMYSSVKDVEIVQEEFYKYRKAWKFLNLKCWTTKQFYPKLFLLNSTFEDEKK